MFQCQVCEKVASPQIAFKSLEDRLYGFSGEFNYVRCGGCNVLQVEEVPKDLGRYYGDYVPHQKVSVLTRIHRYLNAKPCFDFPSPPTDNSQALDVGCGSGWYMEELQKLGWKVHGLEMTSDIAKDIENRTGIKVYSSFEEISGSSKKFDLITMQFSLEHVTKPKSYLRQVASLLKPGGRLIVALPDPSGLEAKIFSKNWLHLDPPRHLTLFTREQIASIGSEMGLVTKSIRSLPAPIGFYGSVSLLLLGRYNWIFANLFFLPGWIFSRFIRDGQFQIQFEKTTKTDGAS